MRMAPASGRITPAIIFRSVVFPEPLGPVSPSTSPGDTDNETPLTAMRPPNALIKPSTCSSAAIASAFLVRARRDFDPNGWAALGRPLEWPRGVTGPLIDTWAWLSRPVVLARHSGRHRGRGAIRAPVMVMNIADTTKIVTFANGTLMPTWRATVSSSPITSSANPSRDRPSPQPTKNTSTARLSRCSWIRVASKDTNT